VLVLLLVLLLVVLVHWGQQVVCLQQLVVCLLLLLLQELLLQCLLRPHELCWVLCAGLQDSGCVLHNLVPGYKCLHRS
jgi:hypothetical protein